MEICISARGLIHNSAESFRRELTLMFQSWVRLNRHPEGGPRVAFLAAAAAAAGRSVSVVAVWDAARGNGGLFTELEGNSTSTAFQVDSYPLRYSVKHQSFYFRSTLQGTPLAPITLCTWTVMTAACFSLGIVPTSVCTLPVAR